MACPFTGQHAGRDFCVERSDHNYQQNSKSESRSSKQIRNFKFKPLFLRFANNGAKNLHQFLRFTQKTVSVGFKLSVDLQKPKSIAAFLCFAAANLNFHNEVLLSDGFIRADVIRADGTRSPDELLTSSRFAMVRGTSFTNVRLAFANWKRAFFQIVRF